MKRQPPAIIMSRARAPVIQLLVPLGLCFLLLLGSWTPVLNFEDDKQLGDNETHPPYSGAKYSDGDIDVPVLYEGDRWYYDGFFDVVEMIANAGTETDAEALTGELEMWVDDITTWTVDNHSSVAYKIKSNGTFIAENVSLSGQSGDITVDYQSTEIIRAGDFATIRNQVYMNVNFRLADTVIEIPVAEVTVTDSYYEPREDYDFPLRVGEEWINDYLDVNSWVGDSNYFTIPEDETIAYETRHAIVSVGDPSVTYSGCETSYNATAFDENGTVESFRWWCPGAKNDAWRHFENALGMYVDFYLKDFQPATPSIYYEVDLEYPTWALNTPLGVWVNVSDVNGAPVADQAFVLRYEYDDTWISLSTAANGTAFVELDTSDPLDTTPSNHDYASHGIVAWDPVGQNAGVDTLSLDAELVQLDYRPRPGGVSVVRFRGNDSMTLNPSYGFNAIAGDILQFTVPIDNKGMTSGPVTELEMVSPDSSSQRQNINALPPVGEQTLQFTWTVPESQQLGLTNFSFEVDPDNLMQDDVNQSNDLLLFPMFIGLIPVADLVDIPSTYTLTDIMLDATGSNDGDGGSLHCTFEIEVDSNQFETYEQSDCQRIVNWPDEGIFHVNLLVTDEENDQDELSVDIEILNRAPWVNVSSPSPNILAKTSITFNATDSGDLDTLDQTGAPLTFEWLPPNRSDGVPYSCQEGPITMECTVTPLEEGDFVIQLQGTDDDGAITTGEFVLQVENIAPESAVISIDGGVGENNELSPAVWSVYEDQEVTLKGDAVDTINDQNSLTWNWKPSSDRNPSWLESNVGSDSEIDVIWSSSGRHTIGLEVVDDNGLSMVTTGQVNVINVPPTSVQFGAQLPVGEDRIFELTGQYSDTPSDMDTLQACWDIDLDYDADDNLVKDDDCDYVGDTISHSWGESDDYTIRFHVTDDDGDVAESLVVISVVNLRPKSMISIDKTKFSVGEEVVIWANGTTDSDSDMSLLSYYWDLDITYDNNNDGDPANDIDGISSSNGPLRHTFDKPGIKNIRLIVSDGDATDTSDITIEIVEESKGFLGAMGETAGISNLLIVLLIVICALLGVGFTIMKKETEDVDFDDPSSLIDDADNASDSLFEDDFEGEKVEELVNQEEE